jgi:Tfp pilus assembly protein PilN
MKKTAIARLHRVTLNHASTATNIKLVGWLLLASGLISLILLFYLSQHMRSRIEALESEQTALLHPSATHKAEMPGNEPPGKREEMTAVSAAMAELKLPWEPLFHTLEKLDLSQVRLIAVEPNARQRKLRITAESTTLESMLEYTRALGRQPILQNVSLLMHDQHNDGRSMPISFAIEAAWLI